MKNKTITIFRSLFNSKDTPFEYTLEKVIERIKKGGKNKDLILKIRKEQDKPKRDKLKSKLACILFAGKFQERSKDGLKKHSGLMVLDFDGIDDVKFKDVLKANKHILCMFMSPSGDKGLKALINIPACTKDEHEKYFKAFKREFKYDYLDNSGCDVSRVCYESYDPKIYVNYKAELYAPELIDEGYTYNERVPLVPINDEAIIVDRIMKFDWKTNFVEGERNHYLFNIAGAFCEYNVSISYAEGYILNNIVHGKFPESEAKQTIKSAYRTRQAGTKYFEDYNKINRVSIDIKSKTKETILKTYNIQEDVYDELKQNAEAEDFWYINEKGKVQISPIKYKIFLESHGFRKHFPNGSEKPSFVYVKSNKVEITNVTKIKDFVLEYIREKKELEVWNYLASFQNLFSELYLSMLDNIDLIMLNDTYTESFIAYRNGILKVTKDSIELVDYMDVDGFIWKSQILDRDFKNVLNFDNDFKKFIDNVSNKNPIAIECVIGYLINTYKNRSNNKAIILNDEVISNNPEGGTGKGLFFQGVSHIRKTHIIDGKKYNEKSQFSNQTVDIDTRILVFDDVKKNWNFEAQFSDITEGITIERKNKDAIKLNVHESPKIGITTNYAIKGEGNSHNRRRHEVEFAQHYNGNHTPRDDFGRELFDDWSVKDFLAYDNYMVDCLQSYLKLGLVKQTAKNIKLRKFISETSMELHEWMESKENFDRNTPVNKGFAFQQFVNEYKDFERAAWFTRRKFHTWVEKYANYKGFKFSQGSSQNGRWFSIDEIKD